MFFCCFLSFFFIFYFFFRLLSIPILPKKATKQHSIKFTGSNEIRKYDLTRLFFRIERLPTDRRDQIVYDLNETDTAFNTKRGSVVFYPGLPTQAEQPTSQRAPPPIPSLPSLPPSASFKGTSINEITKHNVQKKCFSTWCNWYLSFNEQHALEVKDLFKDLADGSILCHLVEELGESTIKTTISQDFHEHPTTRTLMLENAHRIFQYCDKKGVRISDVEPSDIADGKGMKNYCLLK